MNPNDLPLASVEPITANRKGIGCLPSRADGVVDGAPATGGPAIKKLKIANGVILDAGAVNAEVEQKYTGQGNDGEYGAARARIVDFKLTFPGGEVTAKVIRSQQIVSCLLGGTMASGSSDIVNLRLNGTPIEAPAPRDPLNSDTNDVVIRIGNRNLYLNHRATLSNGAERRRAIWLQSPPPVNPGDPGGGDVVVAESIVNPIDLPCTMLPGPAGPRRANCTAAPLTVVVDGATAGKGLQANPSGYGCPNEHREANSMNELGVVSEDLSADTQRTDNPAEANLPLTSGQDVADAFAHVGRTSITQAGHTLSFEGADAAVRQTCIGQLPVFPLVSSQVRDIRVDGNPISNDQDGTIDESAKFETEVGALYLNRELTYNQPGTGYPRRVRYALILQPGNANERAAERRYVFAGGALIAAQGPVGPFDCI